MLGKDLIVIATSAPQDRPGYRRDFLNCLCYPEGTPVRFSYRQRWIERDLLGAGPSRAGQPALIVFCDILPDRTQNFHFMPVRYAQVDSFDWARASEPEDPNAYIGVRFRLGELYELGPSGMDEKVAAWQRWMLGQSDRYPRPPGHPEEQKACFVFEAHGFLAAGPEALPPERIAERREKCWLNLVARLSVASTLQGCRFYRLIGMYEAAPAPGRLRRGREHADLLRPPPAAEMMVLDGHIPPAGLVRPTPHVLESGKSYLLGVQIYAQPQSAQALHWLAVRASTESIRVSQPLHESIGASLRSLILVNCAKVYSPEVATLIIEDPEDKQSRTARAEFLVLLRPTRGLLLRVVGLLALGTLLTGFSAEAIKDIAPVGSWVAGHAAIVSSALKVVASFLVGLGAYLGFRKLPTA